jgi:hypothetical protein
MHAGPATAAGRAPRRIDRRSAGQPDETTMNANWQEFLRASGARIDHDQITDFGDAAAELAAAREATIIAPLSHLGLLELSGPDAASFLHNQLTSDVRHLAAGSAQHSAWCSAKGRMLASFLLLHCDPDYILQLSADLLPFIHKRLSMFVLRSRLSINDRSGERQVIGVAGPQAEGALRAAGLPVPAAPLTVAATGSGLVVRLDDLRFEFIASLDAAPDLWRQLQALGAPGRNGCLAVARHPGWRAADQRANPGRVRPADGGSRATRSRQLSQGLLSRSGDRCPYPVPRQGEAPPLPRPLCQPDDGPARRSTRRAVRSSPAA